MKIGINKLMEYTIYVYLFIVIIFSNTGSMPVKIARVVIMAVFFMYMLKNHIWSKSQYSIWGVVFLIYNIFMIQYAFSKEYAVAYTMTLLYVTVVNICICQYTYMQPHIINGMLKIFIFSSIIQASYIYLTEGIFVFLNQRYTDGVSANIIGMYCAFSAVFCVYMYLENKKQIYILGVIVAIIFMFLSASRKAVLFLGIPIAFYYIVNSRNVLKKIRNLIVIVITCIITYYAIMNVPFLYEMMGKRMEGLINGLLGIGVADGSTKTRLSLISFGIEWFQKKPWFGYGMSNFKALVEVYRSWGSTYYAHNNYVELLVDCGLVGTVIYYALYLKILVCGLRQVKEKKKIVLFLLGCFLSIVVGEYGMVTYNHVVIQLMILIIYLVVVERKIPLYEK